MTTAVHSQSSHHRTRVSSPCARLPTHSVLVLFASLRATWRQCLLPAGRSASIIGQRNRSDRSYWQKGQSLCAVLCDMPRCRCCSRAVSLAVDVLRGAFTLCSRSLLKGLAAFLQKQVQHLAVKTASSAHYLTRQKVRMRLQPNIFSHINLCFAGFDCLFADCWSIVSVELQQVSKFISDQILFTFYMHVKLIL